MYEVVIPINKVKPNVLINLKLVNDNNKNDNAVDNIEINTASFDFLAPFNLKIEYKSN